MSARVRGLTPADVPTFLDLIDALLAYEHLPLTSPEARERLAADALRDPPRFGVWLAEVDSRVVGYAGLIAYADEAHVSTIGVATDRQGEGIGALLLDALLAEADRRSPVVLLEVRADNELAQGLYRRRGFTEIGRRRGYYQPSGADAVVMKRELLG